MTDPTMALRALLEKSSDTELLREMVGFTAQRLMELEAESLTGAPYGKRSDERVNQRNGFRDRTWETRAGTIELRVPKLRHGSYFPAFLEPRRVAEKALTAVIQEAYVQGVFVCFVHNTERPRCLPRSTLKRGPLSANACPAIAHRSSASSWTRSSATCPAISTSMLSWTITAHTKPS